MKMRQATTRKLHTILDLMTDPDVFGRSFQGETWRTWHVFLKALFALAHTREELAVYQRHTRRETPPTEPAREAWLVVGRRGGKSRITALVAVFSAFFHNYSKMLAPGERGIVMVMAADRKQARVVFRYISGLIDSVPMLARMVASRTKESINLTNRITIEVHTANYRAVRGYTVVAAICDEIAFWRSEESANPDTEILNGLRPGMATIPGALLLCISSPYARRGALWQTYREHYGRDNDPVLVWQADTLSMNPAMDQGVIARAYRQDEAAAAAEYGAQFRRDIESFVSAEAIDAVMVPTRFELPYLSEFSYVAFVDPSGGSHDSMSLAIAHYEKDKAVLDALRERIPPFSPEQVVIEFCELLKQYHVSAVSGDRYAGEWPRERFREHGISYDPADKTKSELCLEMLPAINSGKVVLLDNKRLVSQLAGLERRTSRNGKDSIDHAPGAHDDLANAAAGALVMALSRRQRMSLEAIQEFVEINQRLWKPNYWRIS